VTPEEEALVTRVLDSSEMTEHLLSQPRFAELWKLHAWAFIERPDLQDTLPRDKRTRTGWPHQFEADTAGYIKHRVAEIAGARAPVVPVDPPPPSGTNVERLRALINQGEKQ
jgi:hypothetical protein